MAQAPAPKPSFIPRGFISLREAVNRYGRSVMPEAMEEIYAAWRVQRAHAAEVKEMNKGPQPAVHTAISAIATTLLNMNNSKRVEKEQLNRIAMTLRQDLLQGQVSAWLRRNDGFLCRIPTHVWNSDSAADSYTSGRVSWIDRSKNPSGEIIEGECIFNEEVFDEFLNSFFEDAEIVTSEPKQLPPATASHEKQVSELMREIAKSPTRKTRKMALREIEAALGSPVRARSFRRAWAEFAPQEWKKSGSLPKSNHS